MTPGGTVARGYGANHKRTRQAWTATVERGEAICSRCNGSIQPGEPWDLDHTPDRAAYMGPAHRACNRAAGARVANANRAKPLNTSGSY